MPSARVGAHKKIDVYLVEGNPTIWYNKEDVVYNPVIVEAYFSETTIREMAWNTLWLQQTVKMDEMFC
ncbi:MAG: hypothetical protein K2M91_04825 [Lachnospiraceae bacterium]|nr:hypothetical protein [Lachnospiraceae bacterium]